MDTTPCLTLEHLDAFFKEYRQFVADQTARKQAAAHAIMSPFLDETAQFLKVLKQQEVHTAPRFNIFSILNIEHYEEKTHTPFLENLLNVKGSHGQGDLFYQAFLQTVIPGRIPEFSTSQIRTTQEHWTGSGEVDIFIESMDAAKRFCIVLENKIDAGDQKDQLKRYYQYATEVLGYQEDQVLLLYLTKRGNAPSPFSLPTEEQIRLTKAKVLYSISYHTHIRRFLQESIEKVQAPIVHAAIHQYLQLIRTF